MQAVVYCLDYSILQQCNLAMIMLDIFYNLDEHLVSISDPRCLFKRIPTANTEV